MTERILVDSWVVETASGPRTTEIYTDARYTMLVNEGGTQATVMAFVNGEELQRLISALQAASTYTCKRV
jgi:hypothetical protein